MLSVTMVTNTDDATAGSVPARSSPSGTSTPASPATRMLVIIAAAISRFASTLDGLREGYLLDPKFAAVAAADRVDGRHRNPTGDPAYFATAYFHHPDELARECEAAGLTYTLTVAVEGPGWFLPDLDVWLADERRRTVLLDALSALEVEPTLLGMSAHLLAIARRT